MIIPCQKQKINEKFKNEYNNSNKNENHLLLNEFMSLKIVIKSLEIWIKSVLQIY